VSLIFICNKRFDNAQADYDECAAGDSKSVREEREDENSNENEVAGSRNIDREAGRVQRLEEELKEIKDALVTSKWERERLFEVEREQRRKEVESEAYSRRDLEEQVRVMRREIEKERERETRKNYKNMCMLNSSNSESSEAIGAGRAGEERRHRQDKLASLGYLAEEENMRPRGREEGMRNMCMLNSSDSDSSGGTYSQLHQISEEDDKREATAEAGSDSSSLSAGGGRETGRKVTPCVKTANATSNGHATSFSTRKAFQRNRETNRPTSLMRLIFRKMTVPNSKSEQEERLKELEEEERHKKVEDRQAVQKSREERLHLEEEERTQKEKQRQQEEEELRRPEQRKREKEEEETQVAEKQRTEEERRRAAEVEEEETLAALENQRQEREEEANRRRKGDRLGRGEKATKCKETEVYRTLQAQAAFHESKAAISSLCKASSDNFFASAFLEGLDFQNLPSEENTGEPNNGENPPAQEQHKSQVKSTEGEVLQGIEGRGDFLHDDAVKAFVTSALKNACPEKLLARSICEASHNLDVSLHPWDRRGEQAVQSTPSSRREHHSQSGPDVFASTGTLYGDAIEKFKKCLTSYEMESEVLSAQSVLYHSTSSSSFPLTDEEAFKQDEEQEKEQRLSEGFEASAEPSSQPAYMTKANARTSDESSPTPASPTLIDTTDGGYQRVNANFRNHIENLASEKQKDSRISEMPMVKPWVISKVGEKSETGRVRDAAVDTVLPASCSSCISRGVPEVKLTIAAAVSPPPPRFVVNPTSQPIELHRD
jgi:hypothetical protein